MLFLCGVSSRQFNMFSRCVVELLLLPLPAASVALSATLPSLAFIYYTSARASCDTHPRFSARALESLSRTRIGISRTHVRSADAALSLFSAAGAPIRGCALAHAFM